MAQPVRVLVEPLSGDWVDLPREGHVDARQHVIGEQPVEVPGSVGRADAVFQGRHLPGELPDYQVRLAGFGAGHRNHRLVRNAVRRMSAFQFRTCRSRPSSDAIRSEYMIVTGAPDG